MEEDAVVVSVDSATHATVQLDWPRAVYSTPIFRLRKVVGVPKVSTTGPPYLMTAAAISKLAPAPDLGMPVKSPAIKESFGAWFVRRLCCCAVPPLTADWDATLAPAENGGH